MNNSLLEKNAEKNPSMQQCVRNMCAKFCTGAVVHWSMSSVYHSATFPQQNPLTMKTAKSQETTKKLSTEI